MLKYSWNHKVPEHRSAFTYWEEKIPRRIDLGKNKYGGPFTNEEVEDTKAMTYNILVSCPLQDYFTTREGGYYYYEVKKYFSLFEPLEN